MRAASTRRVVLGSEDQLDEPGHGDEEDRHGDEHQQPRPLRVRTNPGEDVRALSLLPVARLLRHEDEPRGRAGGREPRLRRLGDAEETDLDGPATMPSTIGTSVVRREMTPVAMLDSRTNERMPGTSSPSSRGSAGGNRRSATSADDRDGERRQRLRDDDRDERLRHSERRRDRRSRAAGAPPSPPGTPRAGRSGCAGGVPSSRRSPTPGRAGGARRRAARHPTPSASKSSSANGARATRSSDASAPPITFSRSICLNSRRSRPQSPAAT